MTATTLLDHENSPISLEELQELERTQVRTKNRPETLPLSHLLIADEVFQWRKFYSELAAEEAHVKELVRVLEATPEPLDPVLITAVGSSFYVVDGHHRVLAYRRAEWSTPVPVVYFEGTVEEARMEALRLNIKNKLPMTSHDKFEAAWTLVKEGDKFSKRQVSEMTTISERTIATMRAVLRDHPSAAQVDWRNAKRLQFDQSENFDHDDWVEKAAEKMAKQLVQNVGPNLTQRPEVTALALRKISPHLPKALVQEWPEEVEEYAQELAQMKELDI